MTLKPPQPLEPGPVPEPGPPCECDESGVPIPGIIWTLMQPAIPGEDGVPIQKVERCIYCERYKNDEAAVRVVAARYNLEAVFLEDRPWDLDEEDLGKGYGCYGSGTPTSRLPRASTSSTRRMPTSGPGRPWSSR